ncbi:hypothetical protein RiCNE_13790 [Rickettsia endosymbiont of Culicoides newsteadi]|nr:hypothetical protein RiCNE_13790 [Rickettsia endosymbiont of Culicoides newsteadi]
MAYSLPLIFKGSKVLFPLIPKSTVPPVNSLLFTLSSSGKGIPLSSTSISKNFWSMFIFKLLPHRLGLVIRITSPLSSNNSLIIRLLSTNTSLFSNNVSKLSVPILILGGLLLSLTILVSLVDILSKNSTVILEIYYKLY